MFSTGFFEILILIGLTWTAAGAVALLVLLFRDWKRGELW